MGHRGLFDQICPFSACQDDLHRQEICQALSTKDCLPTWRTQYHHIRQRIPVRFSLLGALQSSLGTKLIRSSAFHPQTDGQTKRVNQILEDMLRATVTHFDKSWDKCLPLAEFSYNNNYQTSLKIAPFETLYGRRCRTPHNWSKSGERRIYGPDLVVDAEEKVAIIQANLKSAQSRQKSYHD